MSANKDCAFNADGKFCAECDGLLPLPDGSQGLVICSVCGAHWAAGEIRDLVTSHYEEVYTKTNLSAESSGKADGPEVERLCGSCGHSRATYSTRQTRSADEGMTVFFRCLKCSKQEIEYS